MFAVLALCAPVGVADDLNGPYFYESSDCPTGEGPKAGGFVTISGATLFRDFFTAADSTARFSTDIDCDATPGSNLAPIWSGLGGTYWWVVQYRGIGSGNGLAEFVAYQCNGDIPNTVPSEGGWINRIPYGAPGGCDDNGMDPSCCDSGTPSCPPSVDIAVLDVPTAWFTVVGDEVDASPDRAPGEPGYGLNPHISCGGKSNHLKSFGCLTPADVVDTQIAWVPISIITNHGTGYENLDITALRHLFLTGRLPNGENLVAVTRDSGSGTRNGAMSSMCLDPSWGMGENRDDKTNTSEFTKLGPAHVRSNLGGSSRMEEVVQNVRLAVGYTGLCGSSRSAVDVSGQKYELMGVVYDDRGGTLAVRPNTQAIYFNEMDSAFDYGWQIGGPETMATNGDPMIPGDMENEAAADYIRNIIESIAAYSPPGYRPDPADFMATEYQLTAAVGWVPGNPPCNFIPNPALNEQLRAWSALNDTCADIVFDYGAYSMTGLTPVRSQNPDWSGIETPSCDCDYPANGLYSDGLTGGELGYLNRHNGEYYPIYGDVLNLRNRIAGDWDGDGDRDVDDIDEMMWAIDDTTGYVTANSTVGDPVTPEIIGDYDGNGNFDCRDIRYFADGLALVSGNLCRADGFRLVDEAWFARTGTLNYFGTTLVTGVEYEAGDSRADVAGRTPCRGAEPRGYDCVVDCADINYICENIGAVPFDYSCDMDCDLAITVSDVQVVVKDILEALDGDANLDGVVDADDWCIVTSNLGRGGCWCDGDFNFDGIVNGSDLAMVPRPDSMGDMNCDGDVNNFDIAPFVVALTNPEGYAEQYPECDVMYADINCDGVVDNFDIAPFIALVLSK
jgi:hypothetical protein